MDANQDEIDKYKPALGNGKDAITQAENKELLNKNDITLITALDKDPESFDYKTSYKQDIQYALSYFSPGARQAYEKIDASQEKAFFNGQKKAVYDFGQRIVNAPDDIEALYQAAKEDPAAVAVEILKSLKDIPKEYYDKGVTIVGTSFIGDNDNDFYNSGIASTELGLEAITAIVSAGGAVVVKKGIGKSLDIDIILPNKKLNNKPNRDSDNSGSIGWGNLSPRPQSTDLNSDLFKPLPGDKKTGQPSGEDVRSGDSGTENVSIIDKDIANQERENEVVLTPLPAIPQNPSISKFTSSPELIESSNPLSGNNTKVDTQQSFTSNGITYYPLDEGGYSTTKPLNTADRPVVDTTSIPAKQDTINTLLTQVRTNAEGKNTAYSKGAVGDSIIEGSDFDNFTIQILQIHKLALPPFVVVTKIIWELIFQPVLIVIVFYLMI
ncbi:hypothetical protein ACI2JM_14420 [Psychrobacter sp. NPDC064578]|uniref:hypothetical protein n=1 Tax=Psychrobacter sp. NPDC064578 TaxID=3364493 RepID=UPI00384F0477